MFVSKHGTFADAARAAGYTGYHARRTGGIMALERGEIGSMGDPLLYSPWLARMQAAHDNPDPSVPHPAKPEKNNTKNEGKNNMDPKPNEGPKASLSEQITAIGTAAAGRIADLQRDIEAMDKKLSRMELPPAAGGRPTNAAPRKNPEHTQAFNLWARHGLAPENLQTVQASGMSTVSDPEGGFLIPVELDQEIGRMATATVSMRRLATVLTRRGEYKKPISMGGAGGGWVQELEARENTDTPEIKLFAPPWCEVYANPKCTQKLLDLADYDLERWLADEIGTVFTEKEGAAFIAGEGANGQPSGIIQASRMVANASWVFGKTGFLVSGDATLINNSDKIVDLQHALKPVYRHNGTWLMNDNTWSVIRKLKDGLGNYLWAPGLMTAAPDTLLGKPVEIDDNMPDIGAGAYPICFGDFRAAFTIIDHTSGVRMLRDPFSKHGWVAFYTTKRISAGISNYEALKFLKVSV